MWRIGPRLTRLEEGKKASQEAATIVQERKQNMNKDSAGKDEEDGTGSRNIRQKRWMW